MKKTCKRLVVSGVRCILHLQKTINIRYVFTTESLFLYICGAGKSIHGGYCLLQTSIFPGLTGFFMPGSPVTLKVCRL